MNFLPVDLSSEEQEKVSEVVASADPFNMWAKQMMPSENFFNTYDTKHHNEKRFTDVLR
jgi:hypothetical protein